MKDRRITSVLVGASSVKQLDDNLDALKNTSFANDELAAIEAVLQ
jgi:L-glyceraldehyde 3-phosphate reductase